MVKLLIENDTEVNAHEDKYGATPLSRAAWKNTPEVVRLLIDAGPEVNVKHAKGWTALMLVLIGGHADVVETQQKNLEDGLKDQNPTTLFDCHLCGNGNPLLFLVCGRRFTVNSQFSEPEG